MTANEKIKAIVLLADIQEQYIKEIESQTKVKFDFKVNLNLIKKGSRKLVGLINQNLSEEQTEAFGIESDNLREKLEVFFNE